MTKPGGLAAAAMAAAALLAGCATAQDQARSTTTSTTTTTTTSASPVTTTTTSAAPLLNRRGENGEVVQQDGLVGSGTLRIINDDNKDFAVVVTNGDPKRPQATIYVQANSEATLNGIAGTYFVYLKSGTDWDQATLSFTRNRRFQKFDEPFDESTDWELGLKPSITGNATTSEVPAF
ncbi:hypothetical protein [Nocardia sp. JMUB6875]|uniref:hypothetical protein n=1 Tax=Nocardia sp. JMUB6875 TaxID=3158170 RepID=UPI0034E89B46